jgi:hypothetical protein
MDTMESRTKYIKFMAEDSFAPLFWDDEACGIGDEESFYIGDIEYPLSSLEGIKEWFLKADKYDPYTDVTQFTTEGMEDWINQGYEYAKLLRSIIPRSIDLYYGFWHQFGDGRWRCCRAYISPF